MKECWICCKKIQDYLLLPYDDEYLTPEISIFKNSIIIKDIKPFKFLYFTCCNDCIDKYLNVYNKTFRILKNRELTGNHKLIYTLEDLK